MRQLKFKFLERTVVRKDGKFTPCTKCGSPVFGSDSNHAQTEEDVIRERSILDKSGGGCLYPAGIEARGERLMVRID